ncbi:MAG: phosphatidylserine/phosphatidylglycerophosphate/cardiolipin synthase family protein [Gemmatimonadales bacterium]
MVELLSEIWAAVVAVLTVLLSVVTAGHALIYKRDDKAAAGWVGLILLVPIGGAVLYVLLAINRIRRRATLLRAEMAQHKTGEFPVVSDDEAMQRVLPEQSHHLIALTRLVNSIARRSVLYGNEIDALCNGDEAFPAMLDCIEHAERSVGLSTYIFDRDEVGTRFADALQGAVERGVEVRVLIDAAGVRYSWPSIVNELKRRRVPVARFARTVMPWRWPYLNLRNHRKLLVVDGHTGFTGGMNIRAGHILASNPERPIQDVHFRVRGPVVDHLVQTFREDWVFSTREQLAHQRWHTDLTPVGGVAARGLVDGPDEDFERLTWTILGALGMARHSIKIVTPYFLPDSTLITALNVAALRGVDVEIIIPEKNNLFLVQWAMGARLWRVLHRGCRVYASRPPFDHSKLMLVDGAWALVGSANWDPRSLRLNFEFDIECYSPRFVESLEGIFERKRAASRPVTKSELDRRGLAVRIRDGAARLLTPYL